MAAILPFPAVGRFHRLAAQTGNSYISGTTTDRIEIPTAGKGFLITVS